MILSKAFAAVLTGASLFLENAIAHSVQRSPLSYITRIDDPIIHTPSHRVHAHTAFAVTFLLHGRDQNVRLSLEPNHDIFSGDATIQYTQPDGSIRKVQPIDRRGHRVFKGESFVRYEGQTEWKHVGWARINVQRDGDEPIFEGVFTIDGINHHVQTGTKFRQTSVGGDPDVDGSDGEYMVVWRDSDIKVASHDELKRGLGGPATCGSDLLDYNRHENNIVYRGNDETSQDTTTWEFSPRLLFGRQMDNTAGGNGAGVNLAGSIGSTQGCPNTRRVALIGIATDCSYTADLGSEEAVTENVVQMVNSASQLYESTFNISLAIQNLTISPSTCPNSPPPSAPWNQPCGSSANIETRLSLFSEWRGQWSDTNAYWTLLTRCNSGPAVGLAWLGAVCQQGSTTRNNETSASANVVARTSTEWLVFAHETGHTFGAVHDCTADTCADGTVTRQECCPLTASSCNARAQFIMNPSTGDGITQFSACSIGNICSFLDRHSNRMSCLNNNRGVPNFSGSQCGNGIVETGEDCDCGGEEGCRDNPCCDPQTCRYTTGSQCDPVNEECCTGECRFMSQGSVCRASTGPCDPQEVCSGTSASCPADSSTPDGESCGDPSEGLSCSSGRCTSRTQQCRTYVGGTDAAANDSSTNSCSDSGCIMACSSPRFGDLRCYTLVQYYLDGTPCEGGGRCRNGNCEGVSLAKQIAEWIDNNKEIFIPVVSVVGAIVLICFISCCWSCFKRRRAPVPRRSVPKPSPQTGWAGQYFGAGGRGPGSGGGQGGGMSPIRPGPSYAPLPPQDARWEPMRTTSFRYA
ncbi:Disintegrin and metalloproteinase domain-containing protein B [Madurella mycetomatis]|uniref:Disintegrin and metalloproteinase domain-containing protein B n=1 Tax=Madurella mycetomatis TaxID=100816 RepID=A0A175WI57_9PEZI|nr:Disintegrin and metalloproteinase domain-containing protein B [Madurella mycetomatis]